MGEETSLEPMENDAEAPAVPGVVARPILFVPGAALAGLVLDWLLPLQVRVPGAGFWAWLLGGSLLAAGLAFFVAGMRGFARAETPLPTNRPARVLVTSGVHGLTRNPIYLGLMLLYLGLGVAARSPWMLLGVIPLLATLRYGVVAREEAYLERRFGDTYRDYHARVRRWL
jgi:protein-S-isoprenylcysteine O-methyltransferase Ste14